RAGTHQRPDGPIAAGASLLARRRVSYAASRPSLQRIALTLLWKTIMNYLPLVLFFALPCALAADDGEPLVINGCSIAEASQCPNADLRGADLSNQDLRKMNLAGADLREANLRHARLDLANLEKAQLQNATLTRASLQQTNLRMADLRGAQLQA